MDAAIAIFKADLITFGLRYARFAKANDQDENQLRSEILKDS